MAVDTVSIQICPQSLLRPLQASHSTVMGTRSSACCNSNLKEMTGAVGCAALAPDFGGWIPKKTRIRMGGPGIFWSTWFGRELSFRQAQLDQKGYGTLLFNVPAGIGVWWNMISTKNGDVTYIFTPAFRMGIIRPWQKSSSIFCESKFYILKIY